MILLIIYQKIIQNYLFKEIMKTENTIVRYFFEKSELTEIQVSQILGIFSGTGSIVDDDFIYVHLDKKLNNIDIINKLSDINVYGFLQLDKSVL